MSTEDMTSNQPSNNPLPALFSNEQWETLVRSQGKLRDRLAAESDTKERGRQRLIKRRSEFLSDHERVSMPGLGDDVPPAALVYNPDAPASSFAAAAVSRADSLRNSLMNWACSGDAAVSVRDVAVTLEPTAHEIVMLLDRLATLVDSMESTQAAGKAGK